MNEKYPENFRLDFAVSREQTNEKGEKMYIQTRMAQYAEELWELLKKDNTYVYMCGLKGMEKGIDDIMVSLAAKDGKTLRCRLFLGLNPKFITIWGAFGFVSKTYFTFFKKKKMKLKTKRHLFKKCFENKNSENFFCEDTITQNI